MDLYDIHGLRGAKNANFHKWTSIWAFTVLVDQICQFSPKNGSYFCNSCLLGVKKEYFCLTWLVAIFETLQGRKMLIFSQMGLIWALTALGQKLYFLDFYGIKCHFQQSCAKNVNF